MVENVAFDLADYDGFVVCLFVFGCKYWCLAKNFDYMLKTDFALWFLEFWGIIGLQTIAVWSRPPFGCFSEHKFMQIVLCTCIFNKAVDL